jgi:alkylhydroperoxidase family enzyme
MDDRHAEYISRIVEAVETQTGETPVSLRNRIIAEVLHLQAGSNLVAEDLPDAVQNYITKVALHAYRTTDEDVEALQKIGYTEDAIFELTVSTAVAAGLTRLQRGIAALKGVKDAQ